MMKRRAEIVIKYMVDLDSVPGWGYDPNDWVRLATESVVRQKHYNTSAEIVSINVDKV